MYAGVCKRFMKSVFQEKKKLTVCARGGFHPRVDAMDFLQLLNSNIMEFVLTSGG